MNAEAANKPYAPSVDRFAAGHAIVPGLLAWTLIGDGRRYETWLAWSLEHWMHVVVKLPLPKLARNPDIPAKLAREATILGSLVHPSFQRLLADRHAAALPHLVLDYVEGPTLDRLLEDEGPLDCADVIRLGMQLASALHYLHGKGFVHSDLKPANIVLREGRAVILDLDIARRIGEPAPPGRPHGSPPYMAPEQCRRLPASPEIDVFALGAVLYEMSTGVRAFRPRNLDDGRHFPQLAGRPEPPRRLRPDIPPGAEALLLNLMEPNTGRRPRSALEVLQALATALPAGEEATWPDWVGSLLSQRGNEPARGKQVPQSLSSKRGGLA